MIKTEFLNDGTLIKHYSDAGYMLLQVETGIKYADPVDVVPCRYTYEETNELVEKSEEETDSNEATTADYQDALAEMGVNV
jgi:hypothetical protein